MRVRSLWKTRLDKSRCCQRVTWFHQGGGGALWKSFWRTALLSELLNPFPLFRNAKFLTAFFHISCLFWFLNLTFTFYPFHIISPPLISLTVFSLEESDSVSCFSRIKLGPRPDWLLSESALALLIFVEWFLRPEFIKCNKSQWDDVTAYNATDIGPHVGLLESWNRIWQP